MENVADRELRFRILGPVEALDPQGDRVWVRGQPLRLLGLLLVRRGEFVAADAAIESLWGDKLPAHPENALQLVVSRLRRSLGADAITWDVGGYALRLPARDSVDADRFESLVDDGEAALRAGAPARAAELLQAATELWRGSALQGLAYESYAVAEVARLEERRLACRGARIEALAGLGHHDRVLDELAGLVVEHPLRETFRVQLVRALIDSGRRADALAAYQDARRALGDRGALASLWSPTPAAAGGVNEPPRAARREIVCVFADLRPRAEGDGLDPEALGDVMGLWIAEAETVVRRHGDPMVGRVPEGLVAVFGATKTQEDQCLRAVRAATALARRLCELAGELEIALEAGVGVAAGIALVTDRDALPSSGVVTAAARRARAAQAGEVVLGEEVRLLLNSLRSRRTDVSPLVGRDHDLDRLDQALAAVERDRRAALFVLLGEAGIGKSRLIREFAVRVRHRARVLVGHCPAYGNGVTYWPLREIVVQAEHEQSLSAPVEPCDEARAAAMVVRATVGLGGHARSEAVPWAFRYVFAALARTRPLVLVLEDAHWAETPLLDLLEEIACTAMSAPVLVICVGRPELVRSRPEWKPRVGLRVGPLDKAASRQLLAARVPRSDSILRRLAARASGNPLFLEQLSVHVGEHGGDGALPPALNTLLSARLDGLNTHQRSLIEAAAVEGEVFHVGALHVLVPDAQGPEAEVELEELAKRELLLPAQAFIKGQRAFRFRHALVRDAAYAAMPLSVRADAHERLAVWLAELGAALPDASAHAAAQLERAHTASAALRRTRPQLDALARRAAAYLAEAAREVHHRGDLRSEIAFLDRALALLPAGDATRSELLPALGAALFEAGSLDRAAAVADETVAAGRKTGHEAARWRGEVERVRLFAYRHPESIDPASEFAMAERAASALTALGDTFGVARARYLMCELAWLQGRSEATLRNAREAVRLAVLAGGALELDAGVSAVAWGLVVNRVPVRAAREECAALKRHVTGRRFAELSLQGFAAVLDAMDGRFDAARAALARSRAGLRDLGLNEASIWMAMFDAQAEMLAGNPATARVALDEAESLAAEIGDRWFHSTILVDRAHVVLAEAGAETERSAAVAAIDEVPAPNDAEWCIKRHAALGKFAARDGDAAMALTEARAAVQLAERTEMFLFRADAWRDLAEVAARIGAADEADRARSRAWELYRAKGNAAAIERLREPAHR